MSEVDPTLRGTPGSLEEVRLQLLQAAERCTNLAELLIVGGSKSDGDAVILRDGAKRFSLGVSDLDRVEALLRVVDRSFFEDGPRLPTLLREIANLPPLEIIPPASLPPTMIGVFKCNYEGKLIASFSQNVADWIRDAIPKPWDGKRPSVSSFYKSQQLITEAFFMQEGGASNLPTLLDVFGYYLQESFQKRFNKRFEWIYESCIISYQQGFLNQAGEVLYKIRNLGKFSDNEYKKTSGLKKFEKKMSEIIREYEEILGHPVTPEMLERIALRE